MSNYTQRNNYFESLAHNNKLIAHNRPVNEASEKLRKSYFRVNDLDELDAACKEWAHFPCMVHVGHDITYKQPGTGLPRKVIGNHLYFLSKTKPKNLANEMEAAYTESEEVMNQIISYMNETIAAGNRCGDLFIFDLKGANAEQVGPFNNSLYGWHLTFRDETKACELGYENNDWFTPMEDGEDNGCSCTGDEDGSVSGSAEIIYFNDADTVTVDMDDARVLRLGKMPLIQVWHQDDNDNAIYHKANVPILTNGAPPNVTSIIVMNTGEASGFITLKKTI